jgi:RND superfamily putative drug exporter
MKMFGIGTALAIVIDATVIRGVVVPAFLRLAGELNWWAPRPLKRLHARIGFSEAASAATIPPPMPQQEPETERLPAISRTEADTARYRRRIAPPGPMSAATIPLRLPPREAATERLPALPPTEADTVRYRRPVRPPGPRS